jgi:hypothetical protein
MKMYRHHPMSSPVLALAREGTEVTRLSSPASEIAEVNVPTSKRFQIGIRRRMFGGRVAMSSNFRRDRLSPFQHRERIASLAYHRLEMERAHRASFVRVEHDR